MSHSYSYESNKHFKHEIIDDDTRLQLHFDLLHVNSEYFPLHWHGHLEIIFILKGQMSACINDRRYRLEKDDMLVINPKELHSTNTYDDTSYLLLQIPYDYLSRALTNVSLLQFQEFFPSLSQGEAFQALRNLLSELVETYSKQENGYLFHFSSLVYEFLFILYKKFSRQVSRETKEKENRNFERIEEIIQYVKTHYRKDISLKEASGLINISPEYFCRLFKSHTGQTFLEYLNAVRMIHFYQELLQTDYSITDLMERNGISNYKIFIRAFKSAYGTTPKKLRMGNQ